jgi:putative ABC transport system ATP-binding protein
MSETTTPSETASGTANDTAGEPYRGTVTSPTIVKLSGIAKTFYRGSEPIHVLTGLDLDVPIGSFEALMGPSGSGKSTLLNIIAGLDRPSSGTVLVAGADLTRLSDGQLAKWRSQTIGFVFQSFNLIPVLTAAENVELPLLLTSLSRAERVKHVATALRIVGLEDRMHARSSTIRRSSSPTSRPAISTARARTTC